MIQNWLMLIPEISFLLYLVVAGLTDHFREEKTAKTFFTISKIFLVFIIITTVVFYNQSPLAPFLKNNSYTTLFKVALYLVSLAWFYLSSKWFLNKNRSSYKFYSLCMGALLLFSLLISARHLLIPVVVLPGLMLLTKSLILQHWDEERVEAVVKLYSFFGALFSLLFWGGAAILYGHFGSWDYAVLHEAIEKSGASDLYVLLGIGAMLSTLLFMLALAPFHSWFVGAISVSALPVCGFLTLMAPIAYLACLVTFVAKLFLGVSPLLHYSLLSFAVFSLFIGAFSANGQKNIRQLFAFVSVYNTGFLLFGLVSFNNASIMSVFSYEMIYVLAMLGVYTVFLGLKSKSEYLSDINNIRGLSDTKPYISAALLVFMISLIGLPPMLGFLGRLSIAGTLVSASHWFEFAILLASVLFIANAFLNLIRAVYFENSKNTFDRTDKAIYISLFINLILVMISIFNPSYVLLGAETILKGVFK